MYIHKGVTVHVFILEIFGSFVSVRIFTEQIQHCFNHCTSGTVTEPTRHEASGSKCKLLLVNIVKTQAGSNNSKRVWHGQDTRVILGQAWIFDWRTISRGLDKRGNPIMWAVQAGANRVQNDKTKERSKVGYKLQGRQRSDKKWDTQARIKIRMIQAIN